MPRYPYTLPTKFGKVIIPYDTEDNVPANLPPNTILSIHRPRPETRETGRFIVVQPLYSSETMTLSTRTGEAIPLSYIENLIGKEIGRTPEGIPIIMGKPIDVKDAANIPATPMLLEIPCNTKERCALVPIWVIVLIAVAIASAAIAIIATTVSEHQLKMHAMDLVLQAQDIVDREYVDIDTGKVSKEYFEGADIEIRTLKNGDVYQIALNEKGKEYIGGLVKNTRKGKDYDELLKDIVEEEKGWPATIRQIITWIIIGAVVIGGVYIAVKVVPSLIRKR